MTRGRATAGSREEGGDGSSSRFQMAGARSARRRALPRKGIGRVPFSLQTHRPSSLESGSNEP